MIRIAAASLLVLMVALLALFAGGAFSPIGPSLDSPPVPVSAPLSTPAAVLPVETVPTPAPAPVVAPDADGDGVPDDPPRVPFPATVL